MESKPVEKLFHYTTFESALKIIETCSLKSTRAVDLNDPFDCDPVIKPASDDSEEEYEALIARLIELKTDLYQVFHKEWERIGTEDFKTFFRKHFHSEMLRFREGVDRYFRFICFSQKSDVISMWTHYADKHAGAVIEFDLNEMPFSGFAKAQASMEIVEYKDERPVWDHLKFALDKKLRDEKYTEVLRTKAKCWALKLKLDLS